MTPVPIPIRDVACAMAALTTSSDGMYPSSTKWCSVVQTCENPSRSAVTASWMVSSYARVQSVSPGRSCALRSPNPSAMPATIADRLRLTFARASRYHLSPRPVRRFAVPPEALLTVVTHQGTMYAVIETGGKQYRVELGSEIEVDRLDVEPGQHHRTRARPAGRGR